VGETFSLGNGGVWGCSWTATAPINYDATQADVHAKVKAVLGADLRSTTLQYDVDGSFNITLQMTEGVQDIYARLNISNLQGTGISVSTEETSSGYDLSAGYTDITGWAGTFQLAMATNPTQLTSALSPSSTAIQVRMGKFTNFENKCIPYLP
jgi:hypothetical protein